MYMAAGNIQQSMFYQYMSLKDLQRILISGVITPLPSNGANIYLTSMALTHTEPITENNCWAVQLLMPVSLLQGLGGGNDWLYSGGNLNFQEHDIVWEAQPGAQPGPQYPKGRYVPWEKSSYRIQAIMNQLA